MDVREEGTGGPAEENGFSPRRGQNHGEPWKVVSGVTGPGSATEGDFPAFRLWMVQQ